MKKTYSALLVLAALVAGLLVAQEIATPVSDGANESVTLKKRVRISTIVIERNANVVFNRERVAVDNASNADVARSSLPPTYRRVNAVLGDPVTVGSKTVTFQQFLDLAGKFEETWRAQDEAAVIAAAAAAAQAAAQAAADAAAAAAALAAAAKGP